MKRNGFTQSPRANTKFTLRPAISSLRWALLKSGGTPKPERKTKASAQPKPKSRARAKSKASGKASASTGAERGATPDAAAPRRRRPIWRWVRVVLAAGALALGLPVMEVGCVRFVNPPITPEMVRFKLTAEGEAKKRGLRYEWIPLSEIPRDQVRFVWASEDQRFFEHDGIDFEEIRLALKEAEKSGEAPRGASTISMQCARSVFLWQGRSWLRKGLEAYYTVLMEAMLPKRRILELYLNVIEFGHGVYGVRAAAETFYGKEPDALSRGQMALLVAVMPNPKGWSVTEPNARVKRRQQRVLRLAEQANFPEKY